MVLWLNKFVVNNVPRKYLTGSRKHGTSDAAELQETLRRVAVGENQRSVGAELILYEALYRVVHRLTAGFLLWKLYQTFRYSFDYFLDTPSRETSVSTRFQIWSGVSRTNIYEAFSYDEYRS